MGSLICVIIVRTAKTDWLDWLGLIAIACILGFIYCLYKALRAVFSNSELVLAEQILADYGSKNESIDMEYVIIPSNKPVDVTPLEGDLSNRWDIRYKVVTSKQIKNIKIKKMVKGSEGEALVVLKKWFNYYLQEDN